MKIFYGVLLCSFVGILSCNTETKSGKPVLKAPMSSKLSKEGSDKMMVLITNYYELKNALVASDPTKTTEAGKQLTTAAQSIVAYMQGDSINRPALQPFLDTIATQSKTIADLQDPSCERQRLAFGTLSSAMYGMLKTVEMKNAGIYKQYCPMAFNDKGAYWLSEEEEIKNPYFGKKMLECGEVQDSL